ncbi:hypothetical protein ACR52_03105 [Pseudomonas fildesensis]|uniref:Uncharacterized protein n=1 Tax=Pseudomonas fildesensis TaxID=1674920 RepID=A0A0J8G519_9PSED|nr:hypothetical protein ACR52_03105 [Pseudomonas fildesensis]
MLAKVVNANAGRLIYRGALEFFASKLAPTGDLFQGSTEKTIADSAISPINTTNTLDTCREYWRRDGTLRIAYIGIRNSRHAMIGPPMVSIMPSMLGLKVATAQQVSTTNSAAHLALR